MIGKEIGNYRILDHIGKGGMAVVYRGQHKTLTRRIVAIKVLSAALEGDKSFHERFFREAEVMDRLDHPNIVTLWDFIEQDGQYFIVMEYVDGTTLHHIIKQSRGPLPLQQIGKIFNQVLDAVGYAHKLGIVHRDIKPGNIMINKKGEVKITDFGIARILGENFETTLTVTGMGLGSPYYMSPEQVLASKKHPITAASDIYSLGITLYQMLTGKLPFAEGGSLYTIMQSHVKDTPPPPSQFRPSISSNIEQVVLKAIEKRPEDRWLSCEDFREALDKAISQEALAEESLTEPIYEPATSESVSEIPPSKSEQRPARKSALGLALIIVLIIAGIAIAGGGYYYLSRQREAPKQKQEITTQLAKSKSEKSETQMGEAPSPVPEKKPTEPVEVSPKPPPEKPAAQEPQYVQTLKQAQEAFEKGNLNEAHRLVRGILDKDPNNKEAQDLLTKINRAKIAQNIAAKLDKAEANLKAGNYNLAIVAADEVLQKDPGNTKALDIKKEAQAQAKTEEQKRLTIEGKLAKAEAYLDANRYGKAAKEAEAVLKMDKNNPKAKRILAAARKGARKRAIEAKLAEGRRYLETGKYELALKSAQQILNRFPGEPRAIELRKQAVAGIKRSHSKEEIVSRMLARAERLLETGQFHKARVLADKILDMDPENKRAQDILELAMEKENKQVFQRFLGQGAPGTISGEGTTTFDDEGQPTPPTPTPPLPMPLIPNQ